jgi:hypothetical protein
MRRDHHTVPLHPAVNVPQAVASSTSPITSLRVESPTDSADEAYGKCPKELDQVMTVLRTIEPLLRKLADHEIDTRATLDEVVAAVLMHVN